MNIKKIVIKLTEELKKCNRKEVIDVLEQQLSEEIEELLKN